MKPTGQHFLGSPSHASRAPASERAETPRARTARRVRARQHRAPAAPGPELVPRAGPRTPRPTGGADGRRLPTPRPQTPAFRPAAADGPRTLPTSAAEPEPGLSRRADPNGDAGSKPGCAEGLTFNRLDVAMFLQLSVSRDGARFRGAPGQAPGGGRGSHRGRPARRPAPGVCSAPRGRADSADLVPGTWSFLTRPPYMVTGAPPRERAHANARGDGSGEW